MDRSSQPSPDSIRFYIAQQERVETEETEPANPYKLSEHDLQFVLPLVVEAMVTRGYQPPTAQAFAARVAEVFGQEALRPPAHCGTWARRGALITQFGAELDGTPETKLANQFELPVVTDNLFISLEHGVVVPMTLVEEVAIPTADGGYNMQVREDVLAYNQYLFGKDRSKLRFLLSEQPNWMSRLVTHSGYGEDSALVRWAMDDVRLSETPDEEPYDRYAAVFFHQDCSGDLVVHKRVFEQWAAMPTPALAAYMPSFKEFIRYTAYNPRYADPLAGDNAKFLAHLLYYPEREARKRELYDFYYSLAGFFYEHYKDREALDAELRRQRFFNLPGFEALWEQAKQDGDGIARPSELE